MRNDDRLASAASASSAWPGSLSLRSVRAADAGEAVPDRDADREVNPWSRENPRRRKEANAQELKGPEATLVLPVQESGMPKDYSAGVRRPRVSFGASGRELQCELQCRSATRKSALSRGGRNARC